MDARRMIGALRFSQFFWGVCVLLLILNIVFYASFIKEQQAKISEMERIYSVKRGTNFRKDDGPGRYYRARADLKTFKEKLAPKSAFAETFKTLDKILQKNGLPVSGMTYSPASQPEGPLSLWKYSASFTVAGPYGKLKNLLADIQNDKELYCIESLSMSESSKGRADVEMKLKIASYFK